MKYAAKLTTFALLVFMLTASTAFAADAVNIKPGPYGVPGVNLIIGLQPDGSGHVDGEAWNRLEWKQTGSDLALTIYGEEGSDESETRIAKVLSAESFEFEGLKFMRMEKPKVN
ncbi:hypothetical protein LJC26_05765 [Desulfovibrio sp. OttesenSCG-928-O18]|nr:hypothetical protein [Desulfovibrio sp. OttesenSCG-928-O18]